MLCDIFWIMVFKSSFDILAALGPYNLEYNFFDLEQHLHLLIEHTLHDNVFDLNYSPYVCILFGFFIYFCVSYKSSSQIAICRSLHHRRHHKLCAQTTSSSSSSSLKELASQWPIMLPFLTYHHHHHHDQQHRHDFQHHQHDTHHHVYCYCHRHHLLYDIMIIKTSAWP